MNKPFERKQFMFVYLGKLLLALIIAFLLISLLVIAILKFAQFTGAYQQSAVIHAVMIVQSLGLFLLPMMLFENGRRIVMQTFRRAKLKIQAYDLKLLALYLVLCLGGSMLLAKVSEGLISLLPQSWGLSIEDPVAKMVEDLLRQPTPFYILEILAFCLLPAIVEELFFRATLQRYILIGVKKALVAVLIGAAIFSLFHLSVVGFLSRMWIGFLLGWLYYKRPNIYLPIAVHFINNLTSLIIMLSSIS